jgi:hypothetical protein
LAEISPVAIVAQPASGPSIPPSPKYLSDTALRALSNEGQISYHKGWGEFYAAQIQALHCDLETILPGTGAHFRFASELEQWACYHRGNYLQQAAAVKWQMEHVPAFSEAVISEIRQAGHEPVNCPALSGRGDFEEALIIRSHWYSLLGQRNLLDLKETRTVAPAQVLQKRAATSAGEAFRQPSDL